jgi:hypothetical protein
VSFGAEGFSSTVGPATVTNLAPGAEVVVEIRVRVASCTMARSGTVDGITLSTNGGFGTDPALVRALDRLVAASCPGG